MSRRDAPYKPNKASSTYVIFGTQNRIKDGEVLNDPPRKRRSSKREARTAALQSDIARSLRERYVMEPIRQQDREHHPLYQDEVA